MASEPLEGFQEVNLASPTTPDPHSLCDAQVQPCGTKPSALYCTHAPTSASCPPTTLYVDHLPTQPVYPAPRDPDGEELLTCSVSGLEAAAVGGALQEECLGGEDPSVQDSEGAVKIRSPSMLEVRERGSGRLKEELAKAQRELKLKDEECERLSKVRDQLGQELEDLTASLFQEAHAMVREANVKQVSAEKQLKEALGKIDVLQAEVAALKTLVISTSPTSPCKDMHSRARVPQKKGHQRNKSTSSAMLGSHQELNHQPLTHDSKEVDSVLFAEFKAWREEPTLDRSCLFLERIYREDIYPCLTFCKTELGSAVLDAVEKNTLSVEPVGFQPLPVVKASAVECGGPKKCALSGQTKTCKHRIKLGDSSNYYYISPFCRYRITSVCNFFTYIRYIHQGLVKQQDAEQMFWEVMQLRREMSYAKIGYYRDEL